MLRALAAWWVVMHHCFTMIPKSMLAETSWADSLNPLPVVFTAPWIPLTLFMVISGYSIGTGLAGHTIHWPGYLAARVLRVAPLYWFLLLLGIVTGARTIAQILGVEQDTTRSLVQAILMLPTSTSYTPFPWLATAWSVRIEVVLYLFVPAMVWALHKMQPAAAAAVIVSSCLAVIGLGLLLGADAYTVLYANVPGRLLEFACGLLLAFLHGRDVPRQHRSPLWPRGRRRDDCDGLHLQPCGRSSRATGEPSRVPLCGRAHLRDAPAPLGQLGP